MNATIDGAKRRRYRRLKPHDIKLLRGLAKSGMRVFEIAKLMEISRPTVYRYMR